MDSLNQPAGQSIASFSLDPPPKADGKRVVYPYSIQPGGVHSPQELRELRKHDRVIDSHFAGFDYDRAAVVELKQPRMMYLSYRVGNKVFWTKKRIAIRKGEKLLTDGKITARTRCANRVSELPEGDTSPAEPMAQKFQDPFGAGGSAIEIPYPGEFESALFGRGPFDGLNNAGPPPGGGPPLDPPGGGGFPGVSPPPIPGSCTPPPPQQPPPSCSTPPPPPPPVPEPGTIALVCTGLAGTYLRYRRLKSSK